LNLTILRADKQRTRKTAISQLESKSNVHAQNLAKEAAETEEMEEAIHNLIVQKEEHVARRDRLQEDINTIKSSIGQRKDAQAVHQRALEAQARHNIPELRFWEQCLGLRIEGSGPSAEDQLKFVFVSVDEKDETKEASFELKMGSKEYDVIGTKPKLENEQLTEVVESLNETRELGLFLKSMRGLFVDAVKQ
jgi:kinetochore protein Spc25, fungi type